jgi:large subunit ribosomal protein L6
MSTESQQKEGLSKKRQQLAESSSLPNGVSASFEKGILTVSGPLGKVREDFSKIPVSVKVDGGNIALSTAGARRTNQSMIKTALSIVNNAIAGVTKGYEYRLKTVFAHFPVTVKVQGNKVIVENFYGERAPRIAEIVGDTKVEVQGEDLKVTGPSVQDVGQTAANIEQATTVRRKDQRVFLDGIYVYERIRKK